jgi:PAS domain S-box-containing protein
MSISPKQNQNIGLQLEASSRLESELASLAAIVESSDDAIIGKDLNGVITSWNNAAEQIFGYSAEEAIGQSVTILIPEDRVNEEPRILEQIRRGEKINHYETIRRHKDGRPLDISLTVSPIINRDGVIIGASKIARDITERKRAETAAKERETMLRMIESQEAERRRIARDLHDQVGQQITALRLKVESLLGECAENPTITSGIEEVRGLAEQIDQDIGFLSWELRPVELEDLGLEGALRSFVGGWSRQYGIKAEFHAHTDITESEAFSISQTMEINFYRILQESLNNITKHAEAQYVSVVFRQSRDQIMLVVEDDGRGFDPGSDSSGRGLFHGHGLSGMRERAAIFKGTFEIESTVGVGTSILVRIPLA